MRFAAHLVAMNLDSKGALDLTGRAAEGDRIASARDGLNGKTTLAEPRNHLVHIRPSGSEPVGVVSRRKPAMIVWRRRILLLRHQPVEGGLLACRWLERHGDQGKLHGWIHRSLIHAGLDPRTYMAGQRYAQVVVDGHGDPVRGPQRRRETDADERQTSGYTSA